jgi:hypothetical protein
VKLVNRMLTEKQLKKLAQEVTGRADPTEALEETLRTYVEQKLGHYQQEVSRLEHKYALSFEAFTHSLGKDLSLTWEHEQDYMTWEEALTNLEYFEKIASQLRVHA